MVVIRISAFMLLLNILLLAGCSSTDVSKLDPFSAYVGQTVELRYPVAVVERRSMWSAGDSRGVHSRRSARFGLKATQLAPKGAWLTSVDQKDKVCAELPAGHRVRLEKVRDEVFVDGEQIVAYGRTVLPPNTNQVSFAYVWGFMWTLQQAPWEPESVPMKRYASGKLPLHFNYEPFRAPTNVPTWGTISATK